MASFSSFIGFGGLLIGGIIGGMFGQPVLGATIGGSIGGILGSVLFPEKFDVDHPTPPKPKENRTQIATYGVSIPIVYESARLAGNVIYMSPINATLTQSRHRQDGRRYYEYDMFYTATFAIAFCAGPVVGFSRIWVDNKIFADWRTSDNPYYPIGDTGLIAGNLGTTEELALAYFSTYTGTEDQTADVTLSAILGATETPAYKGICYIVFKDFPFGEFSRMPTIEIEIGNATATYSAILLGEQYDLQSSNAIQNIYGNWATYIYQTVLISGNVTKGYVPIYQTSADIRLRMDIRHYSGVDPIERQLSDIVTLTSGMSKSYVEFNFAQFHVTSGDVLLVGVLEEDIPEYSAGTYAGFSAGGSILGQYIQAGGSYDDIDIENPSDPILGYTNYYTSPSAERYLFGIMD